MSIVLKLADHKAKDQHLNGMLLSFFSALEDIVTQRKRASLLNHFWRERLSKEDKRLLLRLLMSMKTQLRERNEAIQEDFGQSLSDLELSNTWKQFIKNF